MHNGWFDHDRAMATAAVTIWSVVQFRDTQIVSAVLRDRQDLRAELSD